MMMTRFFSDFRVANHSKWTTFLETILVSKAIWRNRNRRRDVSVLWMVFTLCETLSVGLYRVNPQEDPLGLS